MKRQYHIMAASLLLSLGGIAVIFGAARAEQNAPAIETTSTATSAAEKPKTSSHQDEINAALFFLEMAHQAKDNPKSPLLKALGGYEKLKEILAVDVELLIEDALKHKQHARDVFRQIYESDSEVVFKSLSHYKGLTDLLTQTKADLEKKITKIKEEKNKLEEATKGLERDIKKRNNEITTAKNNLKTQQDTITATETSTHNAKQATNKAKEYIAGASAALGKKKAELEATKKTLTKLKASETALKEEIKTLKAQTTTETKLVKELQEKLELIKDLGLYHKNKEAALTAATKTHTPEKNTCVALHHASQAYDRSRQQLTNDFNTIMEANIAFDDLDTETTIAAQERKCMKFVPLNMTDFFIAARDGNLDTVRRALSPIYKDTIKIDAQDQNDKNKTALHHAVENGHADIVAFLLDQPDINVDAKATGDYDRTPLYYAAMNSKKVDNDAVKKITLLLLGKSAKQDIKETGILGWGAKLPLEYAQNNNNKGYLDAVNEFKKQPKSN